MTIRNKTLAVIIIIFIMLIIALYFVLGSVFQQGFIRLEDKEAHDNVKRIVNILSREIDILDIFNRDWSSWDDTYAFIEDSNEEYIESNLTDSTFIGGRLNLMLFINSSNQIVFGKAFDLEEEEEIPIPEDLQKHLLSDSLLTRHSGMVSSVKGIILLSKYPMLITSRPILTSQDKGPIRGALIMGRYLESTEIERLTQISDLSINLQKFNDPQAPPDFQKALSILSEEPIFIQPLNNELVAGYALIEDIYEEPILVLRVDIPRDIYRQSQVARRYLIFSILAIGMMFSLLVLSFLERLVLSPIARVNKYLDIVSSTKDLSFRMPSKGKDEISKLSNTINLMLEKLEASRKELWDNRELYKNLFDNMPGVFYRADREGDVLMINPPGAKLLGYHSPEEIIGKNIANDLYYIPEDRKRFLEELKKRKGSVKDYEVTLKRRDGTPVTVSTSSHYYYDKEGNIAGVEGIFVDITERKEAEEMIVYEQSLLYALMDNISDHIYFKDKKKRFIRVNKAKAEYSEITAEEMIGKTDFDFFPPKIAKQSSADDDLVIETGKPIIDKVEKIIHSDKTEYWFSTTKVPWYNREGKITGLIGMSRNITERKKAEEALYKSQQEFASLFNSSPEALVYEDAKSNIVNINPRFIELFGYTLEELQGKNIDEGMIHPADKKEEGLKLAHNVKGFSNYETIRKRKDDTLIQVSVSSSPVIVNDQLRGFLTLYKDITERKKTEETLKKSQQEFASLFRNSPEALVYVDEESNILDINSQFAKLFSYTLEEIKGRNVNDGMIHPQDKLREAKDLYQKSLSSSYYNYESIRKKKDGFLFPVIISSSPVVIEGKHKGRIISYRDITERKKAEQLQQVLYNISQAASSPISLKQLYKTIHKELGSIIDTTNFYIALVDREEDKILFPYNIDNAKPIHLPRSVNHNSLVAAVIRTGNPIFVNREMIKKEKTLMEFKGWFGTLRKVWLGVPLKVEDKTIGAMVVQSYTNPDLYSKKDIQLLEFVSNQVSTVIERKKMEQELERLAHYDTLTGAYNRGYGLELLQRQLKLAKRNKSSLLLAYSDLDNLKDINDEFSHEEGDRVMVQAAKLFKSILREVDIITRMGGDEFLVIFLDSSLSEMPTIRKRLNIELAQINRISKKPYKIGFSTGFSNYDPENPSSMDELIKVADEKMYKEKKSKNKGR